MIESPLIREVLAESSHKSILKVLAIRFGPLPPELETEVKSILDESVLDAVIELAVSCPNREHFQVEMRAIPRPPEPWDPADEPEPERERLSREESRTGKPLVVDFTALDPVRCPCGWARRAFADGWDAPASVHRVEIEADARAHYHRAHTEIYYVLECATGAAIELDGEPVAVGPGIAVLIPPGMRHRAVGRMTILNVVVPPFDPADEWFD
jgi:mannose-6-phosphate isomerase-like protein (cupin superfamily)